MKFLTKSSMPDFATLWEYVSKINGVQHCRSYNDNDEGPEEESYGM